MQIFQYSRYKTNFTWNQINQVFKSKEIFISTVRKKIKNGIAVIYQKERQKITVFLFSKWSASSRAVASSCSSGGGEDPFWVSLSCIYSQAMKVFDPRLLFERSCSPHCFGAEMRATKPVVISGQLRIICGRILLCAWLGLSGVSHRPGTWYCYCNNNAVNNMRVQTKSLNCFKVYRLITLTAQDGTVFQFPRIVFWH